MTSRSSDCCRMPGDEQGVIIVLTLFLTAVLLALAALAIDSGNLIQRKLQLQKSLDAGALAGIGDLIIEGRTDIELKLGPGQTIEDFIEDKSEAVARENLRMAGIDPAKILTLDAEYDAAEGELEISSTVAVDLLMMNRVPLQLFQLAMVKNAPAVTARAASRRSRANVSLVVDTSNSMNCPAEGDCDCLRPGGIGLCAGQSRLDKLKEALRVFTDQFDSSRDRINLVPFNMSAHVALGVSPSGGFNQTMLQEKIAKLSAKSLTNICDGFLQSFRDLQSNGLIDQDEIAYVFFSDGAPTAARLLLANGGHLDPHDPDNFGGFDYTHYGIRWVRGVSQSIGPSPLVKTGLMTFNHNSPSPPAGSTPSCTEPIGPSDPNAYRQVFTDCMVPNLGFLMPNTLEPVYGSNYDGVYDGGDAYAGAGKPYDIFWREQYFNCAIQLADFLRAHLGIVFGIGLGEAAPVETHGAMTADPYQDVGDERLLRKDIFMARVTNDYLEGVRFPTTEYGAAYPEFSYQNYSSYAALSAQGDPRRGRYYGTPKPEDLEEIFRDIAKRIQLRLIE